MSEWLQTDGEFTRCWWPNQDPLYIEYHDHEWGRPADNDTQLFEKICLEGFQSGLAWITILRKRENFRAAFAGFDVEAVARYTQHDVDRLLGDAGIVRHRAKIESTINNAQRAIDLAGEYGSLAAYFWSFEPETPERPGTDDSPLPATTPSSIRLSKDLKTRGWTWVGPTTAYAFMQAMGLVNDHIPGCDAYDEVEMARAEFDRPLPGLAR